MDEQMTWDEPEMEEDEWSMTRVRAVINKDELRNGRG
jgi:hypothetical protein